MTEKRFWYDFEDYTGAKIVDFKENKEYLLETIGDFRKIEKLLNEQHEQIQILKATNGEMEDYLARLEEENEQLKSSDTITDFECEIEKLKKENEQLKSENDKFRSFIRRNHAIGMIHRILKGDVE